MGMIIFQRAVYYRERAARAYRSFTYLFALLLANLPFLLTYTILFALVTSLFYCFSGFDLTSLFFWHLTYSIPIYWLVGFQADAGKFFIFLLIIILALLQNQALLSFIGVASPTMVIAFTIMAIVLSSFALFTGFLIKYQNMPVYWYWAFYIDFTAYPLDALLVNEFTGKARYLFILLLFPPPPPKLNHNISFRWRHPHLQSARIHQCSPQRWRNLPLLSGDNRGSIPYFL